MLDFNDQNFEKEVVESDLPVLVDFWAPWCGPCQAAGPIIDELAKDYQGKLKVGKLNVDENPQAAGKYMVMSIPTVLIFKNGKEVKRQVGFPGKQGYINILEEVLDNE